MAEKYLDEQKYRDDITKLKLNHEEKEKAHEILDKIEADKIDSPKDFLEEWKDLEFQRPNSTKETRKYIELGKIKGSQGPDSITIWKLKDKLNILAKDDWIIDTQDAIGVPHLVKHSEKEIYHVGTDGHHRIMAFKALGIDKIKARYNMKNQ